MGHILKPQLQEFVSRVPENLTQAAVHPEHLPFGGNHGHADGGLFEHRFQALLALSQVFVKLLLLAQCLVQVDLHAHPHADLIHVEWLLDVVHCAGGNPLLDVAFLHSGADQRDRHVGGARVVLDATT